MTFRIRHSGVLSCPPRLAEAAKKDGAESNQQYVAHYVIC